MSDKIYWCPHCGEPIPNDELEEFTQEEYNTPHLNPKGVNVKRDGPWRTIVKLWNKKRLEIYGSGD